MSKITNVLSYKYFKSGAAWIIFIIGICLYIIGFLMCEDGTLWKEVCIKVADVFVIGVIIGYLSNAAQFLGVFKQDLQDIIYGKEFIKQKKDIYPLWETVSKEMFKNKFPSIHKEFLKTINSYFPQNEVSYYNDFEAYTSIEWDDKEKDVVKVIDTISFDLIAENENEIIFPLKTWTRVNDTDAYKTTISMFKVNGNDVVFCSKDKYIEEDNICEEFSVKLSGTTKYSIKYKREKIYDLKTDFILGFRAKYIVNGLRVRIDCPDDINLIFACRGTQNDFEDGNTKKHSIEKKYKGIILPRQGYICALQKNNQP